MRTITRHLIPTLAAAALLAGCASGGPTRPQSDVLYMAGVAKLTEQLVKGDEERAQRVRTIAAEINAAASQEAFATVDLLIEAIREHVQWDRLSPTDAAILEELLKELRAYLVQELGDDILPEHLRLTVEKVSGWVILGARA